MATNRNKRGKTLRKTQKTEENLKENLKTGGFTLGDTKDDADYSSGGDQGYLKLENEKGDNIFCLVHPDYVVVREHWVDTGEAKMSKIICGLHLTNDLSQLTYKMGDPENCPMCLRSMELFKEAKNSPNDIFSKRKKEIAKNIQSKLTVIMGAIKGEGVSTRIRGKKIVVPEFDNLTIKRLALTKAAFDMFFDAFNASDLNSKDIPGMPVNFKRAKKSGKKFSEVIAVEFYPKYKIDAPEWNTGFDNIANYNPDKADEIAAKHDTMLVDLLSGNIRKRKLKVSSKKRKT